MSDALSRIADALERLAPPPAAMPDLAAHSAFVWDGPKKALTPVKPVSLPLDTLVGIDRNRDTLMANTRQFACGYAANNALLWGARGMGKSSLVKSVHAAIIAEGLPLTLIEITREDLPTLPALLARIGSSAGRFVLFLDDLSFEIEDAGYKSLKTMLDGGLTGRPQNTVLYATSNRRHLMPREMIENERGGAISPHEAVDEKVSLSDRFGLWLGFHPSTQDEYLQMIAGYCQYYGLSLSVKDLKAEAIEWQATRGARSGRVAWQFFTDLAGRHGVSLDR